MIKDDLQMMCDTEMMRNPDVRIQGFMVYTINVGTLSPARAEAFCERLKDHFCQQSDRPKGWKFVVVPVRGEQETKIEIFSVHGGSMHEAVCWINDQENLLADKLLKEPGIYAMYESLKQQYSIALQWIADLQGIDRETLDEMIEIENGDITCVRSAAEMAESVINTWSNEVAPPDTTDFSESVERLASLLGIDTQLAKYYRLGGE